MSVFVLGDAKSCFDITSENIQKYYYNTHARTRARTHTHTHREIERELV